MRQKGRHPSQGSTKLKFGWDLTKTGPLCQPMPTFAKPLLKVELLGNCHPEPFKEIAALIIPVPGSSLTQTPVKPPPPPLVADIFCEWSLMRDKDVV